MTTSPPALWEIRRLVRVALWAALIAVGAWLTIPLPGGVPLSLQTFFVLLAGLTEGPRIGAQAAGLYLLAGLLGLPVFAGGLGGPSIIFRPSAGFALAFPLMAAVAGLAARRGRPGFGRAFLWSLAAQVLLFFCGFWGIRLNTGLPPLAVAQSFLVFLPGLMIKSIAAAAAASSPRFHRLVGAGSGRS